MKYLLGILATSVLVSGQASTLSDNSDGCSESSVRQTNRMENVTVTHPGIPANYVKAIGRTVAAARRICVHDYGFNMPNMITVHVQFAPNQKSRLFNDGHNTFSLSLRGAEDLLKPATSGIFHLYGLCHETAHLAMYRVLTDRTWLTTAATEGWAHYLGSHLVDQVYAQEGPDLWPDNYNYIKDGTYRLRQQLGRGTNSATLEGARLWRDLGDILNPRDLNQLFKAWGKLGQTAGHETLKSALLLQSSDSRLRDWWDRAAPVLLENVQASTVSTKKAERKDLLNQPKELFHDDNQPAGKRSLAGSGHAVKFEIADTSFFLTAVRIHGSRYGTPQAPAEEFSVWLCDEDFKAIEQFKFPYSRFARGQPSWVELPVEPTSLPRTFLICVGFNPAATKGVYVSHDAQGQGTSVTGLPGKTPRPFPAGDWMIRGKIDKKK